MKNNQKRSNTFWGYFLSAVLAVGVLVWLFAKITAPETATSAVQTTHVGRSIDVPMASAFSGASSTQGQRRAPPPPPARVADHIASTYADSAATREALTQIAYGWSQAIHDVQTPADAKDAGNAIAKGIACALSKAVLDKSGVGQLVMLTRIKDTRAIMLDSEADTRAYIQFQLLAGGQYFDDPGSRPCGFDLTSMQN